MDEMIQYTDNIELKDALRHITEHVVNKTFYYSSAYRTSKGVRLSEDFSNQNQRRSYYLDSIFYQSNMSGAGFTDSIFRNTHFDNCNLDHTNFESCYILNCKLYNTKKYFSASFAKSLLYDTLIENGEFVHCRLADSQFLNSTIKNCKFNNTTFDGAVFDKTIFDNVSFANLNLEYVQFHDVVMHNTVLPFPTIPFIINGIKYLKQTSDNVRVKSAKYGSISKEEYLTLIPYLKIYYEYSNNYFPLSNIYIAENNTEQLLLVLQTGIYQSMHLNNYKQLKNYCLLAKLSGLLTINERKKLLDIISTEANKLYLQNTSFYSSIINHISELRDVLLDDHTSSLILSFKTNICNNDYKSISIFYEILDVLFTTLKIESRYNINFTYNSCADVITTISSIDTGIIVALIGAVTTLLISGIKGLSQLPEVISKFASIRGQLEKEKYQIENQKLENQKLILENKKLQHEIDNIKHPSVSVVNDSIRYINKITKNLDSILTVCEKAKENNIVIERINCNAINISQDTLTTTTRNIIYNSVNTTK